MGLGRDERRSGRPRSLRRLLVLATAITAISAVRNVMLARNEKRYPDLIRDAAADRLR